MLTAETSVEIGANFLCTYTTADDVSSITHLNWKLSHEVWRRLVLPKVTDVRQLPTTVFGITAASHLHCDVMQPVETLKFKLTATSK